MLITKIVEIEYDDVTGAIEVNVLDELEGVIEYISITNSETNNDLKPINFLIYSLWK